MPLLQTALVRSCLLTWPASHHFHTMLTCLKFCLSTSLWHFPFPTTFRHLTSTRLPPELQSDYDIVRLLAISKACTHERTKLDFFKQEDILVINMSLLFCSLLIRAQIRRLFYSLGTFLLKFALQSPKDLL